MKYDWELPNPDFKSHPVTGVAFFKSPKRACDKITNFGTGSGE
jgi:hypothetical protein